ncbi:MAG: substrate-binding domain-containing protein [Halobacteriota archaeon]
MTDNNKLVDRRSFIKTAASATALAGIAGCTGGSDGGSGGSGDGSSSGGGSSGGDGSSGGSNPTTTSKTSGGDELDFGGESIHVMLNAGALAEHQRKNVIPRVEEKYNLVVNDEQSTTGQMITQIRTNPESPPDVVDVNVNGVYEAQRNDWLASIADHTDIVTNYSNIFDEAKYYGDTGVSWYFGELAPIINEDNWNSRPTSWMEVIEKSDNIALAPFAWTQGLMLMLASSIASEQAFDSGSLDIDAGFDWMEEHIKPKHSHTIEGISQANQLLLSGEADVLLPAWDIWVTDLFMRGQPIRPVRTPDPVGIAAHESIAVPSGVTSRRGWPT